jgi:hypothetical protein
MTLAAPIAVAVSLLLCTGASAASANDRRVVLNERIGSYRNYLQGGYAGAVKAFGRPASSGSFPQSNLCTLRWLRLGLDMDFITLRLGKCATAGLAGWYRAKIRSREWLVGRGIRVGDTVRSMRRLYPRATFDGRPPGQPTWTLVSIDGEELGRLPVLTAVVWDGRITEIHLPYPGVY